MEFSEELERVLPEDLPHRHHVIEAAAKHLGLIAAANEYMNLTRILNPRDAAIKHVYDSIAPWQTFVKTDRIMDAGTGAGFPGIPLAVALPDVQFLLVESTGKKARFLADAVESLQLPNVEVLCERAEQVAQTRHMKVITARAVAPLDKLLNLFAKSMEAGARLILYKGPNVENELAEARRHRVRAKVLCRYELPDNLGARTILQVQSETARARIA